MTTLDEFVDVQIEVKSSALTLPGFGVPMILATTSNFAEARRRYSDLSELLDDGFLTSDAVYRIASKIFSQNPHPEAVMVGKKSSAVASIDRVVVLDDTDGAYTITIDGQAATFTASSNTADQIKTGLIAAVNALVPHLGRSNITAASVATGILSLTADTAGIPVSISLTAPAANHLAFAQNVALAGNTAGNYTIIIGSKSYTVTANGVTSASDLADQLIVLINAGTTDTGVTAIAGSGDSVDLQGTEPFVVSTVTTGAALTQSQRTLVNGIAEDLDTITALDSDWYTLLLTTRDDATNLAAAEAIETRKRTFVAQTSAAGVLATPYNSGAPNTDIASKLKALGLIKTMVVYSSSDTNDVAAGIVGVELPNVPGSSTAAFKTLAGVEPDALTTTQLSNLESKNGSAYYEVAGRNIFFEGKMANGYFFDFVRGLDKLNQAIQASVFGGFVSNKKIPYTQKGIDAVTALVRAPILESVSDGFIAESRPNAQTGKDEMPAFSVRGPNLASISQSDRELRIIPASHPIRFEATPAGALHRVKIRGTVTAG